MAITQKEIKDYFLEIKELVDANKLGTISYSKLSVIKQCPFVYHATYVKRYARKEDNTYTKTNVGKFIHAFLERMAPLIAQESISAAGEVDADLVWASLLKEPQYKNLTYMELEEAEALREDAINIGNFIGSKYNNNTHNIYTEEFIGINRDLNSFSKQAQYNNLLISGYIDVLAVPKTSAGEALLLDYKTFPKTNDSFELIKPQLELYALLLFFKHAKLNKINAMVSYIPQNKYDSALYTREDVPMLFNNFKNLLKNCEDILKYHYREKTKGRHCEWCGYKYICD